MTASEREQFNEMKDVMTKLATSNAQLAEANIELTVRLKSIHAQLCKINRQLNERVER